MKSYGSKDKQDLMLHMFSSLKADALVASRFQARDVRSLTSPVGRRHFSNVMLHQGTAPEICKPIVHEERVERKEILWNRSVKSCRPALSIPVTGQEDFAAVLRYSAIPFIALLASRMVLPIITTIDCCSSAKRPIQAFAWTPSGHGQVSR